MKERVAARPRIWLAAVVGTAALLSISSAQADEEYAQIRRGFEIVGEIFPKGIRDLNLAGKDRELVGLGSYLVNTTGCNDCHTYPNWLKNHNPFMKEPERINWPVYLSGGRFFGPTKSANITPDASGKPAGLSWWEFRNLMRTGQDPDHPAQVLQVMPWPLYKWKTDKDLRSMYEYLRAIPSLPDNPNPGS